MECRKIDLSFLGMGEGKKNISSKIFKAMKKKNSCWLVFLPASLFLNHLNLNILNPCFMTEQAGPAGTLLDFLQLIKECPMTVQEMQ